MTRAPYSAQCDMLFNFDNFELQTYPLLLQPTIKGKVGLLGNWVGGEVHCLTDRIVFSMGARERLFQREKDDVVLPFAQIESVRLGRHLFFVRTVDVETTVGPLRLRSRNRENEQLLAEIGSRLAGEPD